MSAIDDEGKQIPLLFADTIEQAITGFIQDRSARRRTPGTIRNYSKELEQFAGWLEQGGVHSVFDVTPSVLRQYVIHLSATRNTGGVHAAFRVIRALFNWYDDEFEPDGWRNPVKKVKVAAPSKKPKPGIPIEHVYRLADACATDQAARDRAAILCLADTGARATEFTSLNVVSVNFATGAVYIERGKGGKSRTVFIGSKSKRTLRKYLLTRTGLRHTSPLFLNDEGERMTYMCLVKMLRRRAVDAGLPFYSPHDFRRCFAVEMLRNGCDVARLSYLMGHESVEVTMRYLALIDDDLLVAHRQASPIDNYSAS